MAGQARLQRDAVSSDEDVTVYCSRDNKRILHNFFQPIKHDIKILT